MELPFIPLTRPTIDEETIAGVCEVLRSGWITSGPNVKALEAKLSALFGGRPVRAFNSGTGTLEIGLRLAGVGPGDEVITTPLSWVATSNVILEVGARPVFVEIDPVTRNLDLDAVEKAITPATKAILPVDLAGLPVDRDRLYDVAKRHGLRVIEDAAQSIGSSWKGRLIGSFGDLVSFSFHPNKNLTTIEGGCLVMNTPEEALLAEQYRLQGVIRTGMDGMDVEVCGGKFNLTDVAACVGLGQLPHLEAFTEKRRELVRWYFAGLDAAKIEQLGVQLPPRDFEQSNWHMFQLILPEGEGLPKRAEVMERLKDLGVGTGAHYPAIHLFTLYRGLGWKDGDFPIAESVCRTILTLPLFPTMELSDVDRVVSALVSVVSDFQKK
ncbi:MAG: aminotransferase DegT [Verrucomicrobiales bacterium VVV1]|nr:MAG: aminotransferase DegT [Verrucomicrobiales bacterium VVV1]